MPRPSATYGWTSPREPIASMVVRIYRHEVFTRWRRRCQTIRRWTYAIGPEVAIPGRVETGHSRSTTRRGVAHGIHARAGRPGAALPADPRRAARPDRRRRAAARPAAAR